METRETRDTERGERHRHGDKRHTERRDTEMETETHGEVSQTERDTHTHSDGEKTDRQTDRQTGVKTERDNPNHKARDGNCERKQGSLRLPADGSQLTFNEQFIFDFKQTVLC